MSRTNFCRNFNATFLLDFMGFNLLRERETKLLIFSLNMMAVFYREFLVEVATIAESPKE
ncbi:MAG: hypothetical protein ACM3X9_01050 [Bacillota bacterium]